MSNEGERYSGAGSYIFISYSHDDSERVLAIVAAMDRLGYRVWYDAGIRAGQQWTEELSKKIADCEIFLPFISRSFAGSEYCKQEVRYAHSKRRSIVPVKLDLERQDYPPELAFLLENAQGFAADSFPTPEAFAARLDTEPLFQGCRGKAPDVRKISPAFTAGNSENASSAMKNGRPYGDGKAGGVEIIKVDEYDRAKRLPNVTFEIRKQDGGLVKAVTTGNGGRVSASLNAGNYALVELEAPDGYQTDPTPTYFTVQNGGTTSLTIKNRPSEPGGVEITKVDKNRREKRLSNATFEIRKQNGGLVKTVTTGSGGRVSASLKAGEYELVELEPPDGYQTDTAPTYFTVKSGETTPLTIRNRRANSLLRLVKLAFPFLLFIGVIGVIAYISTHGGLSPSDSGESPPDSAPVQYLDTEVSIYAGGGSDFANHAELFSPDYMDEEDGVLYVWDSGSIRELKPGSIRELRPMREDSYEIGDYPPIDALHVRKGDVYVLTAPWAERFSYVDEQDETNNYTATDYKFTILRVRGGDETYESVAEGSIPSNITDMAVEPFYAGQDMLSMRFTDFELSNDGSTLWLVQQDAGIGAGNITLERIRYNVDTDRFPSGEQEWFADLQWNVTDNNRPRLAVDDKDNLYISFPEDHCIAWFNFEGKERSFDFLAGDKDDGSYRDGDTPAFIKPTSIAVKGDYLYVYDSGAVRRVSLQDGACVTMAGRALRDGENPIPAPEMPRVNVSGKDAVFPCGEYPGLAVRDDGKVFLCDNVRGVIYQIAERTAS